MTPRNGPGCDRFHAISLLFRGWPFPIPDNVLVDCWIVDGSNLFGFSRGRYELVHLCRFGDAMALTYFTATGHCS